MNRLSKNLRYDIKAGFGRNLPNYLIEAVVLVFLTGMILSEMKELYPHQVPSCFDVISRFFMGVDSDQIEIPFQWLTIHTYIILGIARYPRQDYDESSYNIWIRTKSRAIWWLSKVIWCLLHVALSYVVGLIVVIATVMLSGGDYSMRITNLYDLNYDMSSNPEIYAALFLMPVIVEFAVSVVAMSVSFIANSIVGFLTGFVILVSSVFFYSRFCLGRYMMLYSYFSRMADYRFSAGFGALLCLVVVVCGLTVGYMVYLRKE